MSKKENTPNSNGMPFGEISTIRDILMGSIMTEYNSRFDQLENSISNLEKMIKEVQHILDEQIGDAASNTNNRFEKQEAMINKLAESLEHKFNKSQSNDKVRLGKMLADVGKKLMGD